jgi:hypothetical protein
MLTRKEPKSPERPEFDHDRVAEGVDSCHEGYQVTSPAPARLFATRASTNSKSERRLR